MAPARSASTRAGRQRRSTKDPVFGELASSIDTLIKENRALKKRIAALESEAAKTRTPDSQALRTMQRRLAQALDGVATKPSARASIRRRITDPVVLEKRRAALAKARQALAEKRAADRAAS